MDSTRADPRIGVIVVTGFLGSGKTTLLNRVLADARMHNTLVMIHEAGELCVDHHLVYPRDDSLVLSQTGCACRGLNDDFANTLRKLFMLARQRCIRPFDRVLVESFGLTNPATLLSTLRLHPFLAEHYAHAGTVTVADAPRIVGQLAQHLEAAQQVMQADLLVLSHTHGLNASQQHGAERALAYLQPSAQRCWADKVGDLTGMLLGLQTVAKPEPQTIGHCPPCAQGETGAFSLQLPTPLRRNAFLAGMARLQERYGEALLRIKGLVDFVGETLPHVVHGVHQQLYPLTTLPAWPDGEQQTRLVFIARGANQAALQAEARERLREAVSNRAG